MARFPIVDADSIKKLTLDAEILLESLFPIMRSITGSGVRQTHKILHGFIPLVTTEVASGTKVLDWVIPEEWWIKDAKLVGPNNVDIINLSTNNLHVVNYSTGVDCEIDLEDLQSHLHSIPELPNAIPYLTSYYSKSWGFCLTHEQRIKLIPGKYHAFINAGHKNGSLTYSVGDLHGTTDKIVLFSTYTCHPQMANNELSGPIVSCLAYKLIEEYLPKRKFNYRFLFIPETIGSITYLSRHGDELKHNLLAGYVLTCIGDSGPYTLKRSRIGNSLADRAAKVVWKDYEAKKKCKVLNYFPMGSDERQYCSPGFNLPVAVLSRSIYGSYSHYHTSLDDLSFVSVDEIVNAALRILKLAFVLENNSYPVSLSQYGEPNFSSRGLQSPLGAKRDRDLEVMSIKWILNLADGEHDLIEISELSGIDPVIILNTTEKLVSNHLLELKTH